MGIRNSGLTVAALVVCLVALGSCRNRKPSLPVGRDAAAPVVPSASAPSSKSSELFPAASVARSPSAGESRSSTGQEQREPAAHRAEIGRMRARLDEIGSEMGETYRRIAECQKQQRTDNPEIAGLSEEIETIRRELAEKFNSVPGMAEKTERKTALQTEKRDLLARQKGLAEKTPSAEDRQNFLNGRVAHYARLREITAALGAVNREIAGIKGRALAHDPEIRSLSGRLSQKELDLTTLVNSAPEMQRLRMHQQELDAEATALIAREQELTGQAPGGGAETDRDTFLEPL